MVKSLFSIGFLASITSLAAAAPVNTPSTNALSSIEARSENGPFYLPDNCYYPDYMAAPRWVGGKEDNVNLYCVSKWTEGLLIAGITTYTKDHRINGLQVTYSDGSKSWVYGTPSGDQDHKEWGFEDQAVLARMWGNGGGKFLGQLEIQTKSGVGIKLGNGRTDDEGAFSSETGGGLLMGMFIATAKDESAIVRAGFLFLKDQITEVLNTGFEFDQDLEELNSQQRCVFL